MAAAFSHYPLMEIAMTLDVAISTLGETGIRRTAEMHLPAMQGVRYIVSWQTDDDEATVPEELLRDDIAVHRLPGRGLSRNRNNALDKTNADIVLIADDDLRYTPQRLQTVIDIFSRHPQLDFATFMFDGDNHKCYPDSESDLRKLPAGYFVSSVELALTRRVIDSGVRYDTRFGLGSDLGAGEDELMYHTLRHRGFIGRFFPVTVTYHAGLTTGFRRITDNGVARAMGAVIGMAYPATGILRVPLKALRMHRSGQMSFPPALHSLAIGWIRQLFMKRPWKR